MFAVACAATEVTVAAAAAQPPIAAAAAFDANVVRVWHSRLADHLHAGWSSRGAEWDSGEDGWAERGGRSALARGGRCTPTVHCQALRSRRARSRSERGGAMPARGPHVFGVAGVH
mmetsp:Transcript_30425/g.83382  ORF Transcript_30425/g.83382 Transcript_30425/m.83382 type:complete len:116 (-) Transcript_30425:78-425(-)